ncbi:glycosyltransferase [Sphingomonas sp. PL-96]|uniref:glycosyltransferase n=1 Tax=Sphingomonas sp. PL-96 TaxID=2887201 RepID=UPI001E55ACB8|nr:glycosyltransferase [Sphingomonas sp. PL-96]MCC2975518.1 glycosyltransferase [Sphingomonas sp. PL-96]
MTPIFSIVTIVRNDPQGLERTRASLAVQTDREFEWILIDGASTDTTRPLVRALLAAGEARGVSEADGGIYDAMNKGLRLAAGRYVLFLNAGDRLLDGSALVRARHAIAARGDPDIAFFASQMAFGRRMLPRPVKSPTYVWHGQPGLHQATFVRRSLHLAHPFDQRYRVCGDYDALARMAKAGAQMVSIDEAIGVNLFERRAMSANKRLLIREAAAIQRSVLRLPGWQIAVSAARRALNSGVFALLTRTTG